MNDDTSMPLSLATQSLLIAGRSITLSLPADPEQMLEQALQSEAAGEHGSDPYWGLLWAASPKLAELILRHEWDQPLTAIELGCGVGLAGIAALIAGHQVVFSDHSAIAVRTSLFNARANGFANAEGLTFAWHDPPQRTFEFAFASDVVYDTSGHRPLLHTLDEVLRPDGLAWIGDVGRANMPRFLELAETNGWRFTLLDRDGRAIQRPNVLEFCVIELRRMYSRREGVMRSGVAGFQACDV